jgi:hypothetical protein
MILSLIKKFGSTKFVFGVTVITASLSVIITAISLSLFQGYIDMLGIILAVAVPALLLPIPATCCFQALLRLDITESKLEKKNIELEKALTEVNKLGGLFPICANCKKIRDTGGLWNEIEEYIRDNSEAEFSHSLCPECAEALYPGFLKEA